MQEELSFLDYIIAISYFLILIRVVFSVSRYILAEHLFSDDIKKEEKALQEKYITISEVPVLTLSEEEATSSALIAKQLMSSSNQTIYKYMLVAREFYNE